MTAKTFFRNAGALRQLTKVFYRDAGVLRTIRKIYYRDAGALRLVFDTAGGGGGGGIVNIENVSVALPTDQTGTLTFSNAGVLTKEVAARPNEWLTTGNQNTTNAALYEIQATVVGADQFGVSGPATGTYWPLSTTRTWGCYVTGPSNVFGSGSIMISIRRASDQVVVATAEYYYELEKTPY